METFDEKIPRDIFKRIVAEERKGDAGGRARFYPYFEMQGEWLAISTVAVRGSYKHKQGGPRTLWIKKVAISEIGNGITAIRDIDLHGMAGYIPEWEREAEIDGKDPSGGIIENLYGWEKWVCVDQKFARIYRSGKIMNVEFLQNIPALRYCAYDGKADAVDYLNAYLDDPRIELITKLLDTHFAVSKSVVALAGKDRKFVQWLKVNREELLRQWHDLGAVIEAYKRGMSISDAEEIRVGRRRLMETARLSERWGREGGISTYDVYKGDKARLEKIVRYIMRNHITAHHYDDYLRACLNLGLDMNDTKNLLPLDFAYWSEVRINQYATKKAELDKKQRKKLEENIRKVAEKYSALAWGNGKFIAIIADSKSALIREGEMLHHCVGRMDYDQRIVKEQSLIFFIRAVDAPDKPIATVELAISKDYYGQVRQCYGDHDSRPTAEVLHFVNEVWQPKASRQLKEIRKKVA